MQLPSFFTERPVVGLAIVLTTGLVFGGPPATWYWADREASARGGGSSTVWTFVYLVSAIGMFHYLYVRYVRRDLGTRDAPPAFRERLATTYSLAVVVTYLVGAIVSPPDPVTQVLTFPPLFAAAFGVLYLLICRDGIGRIRATVAPRSDG